MSQVSAQRGSEQSTSDIYHYHNPLPEEASRDEAHVRHVHIGILGTGFSGLGMAIRLKQRGEDDFVVIEKANDIGGTWRDDAGRQKEG